MRDVLVRPLAKSMTTNKSRESVHSFEETGSLGTTTTAAHTYKSMRANSFL